jgi:hypothetical protein
VQDVPILLKSPSPFQSPFLTLSVTLFVSPPLSPIQCIPLSLYVHIYISLCRSLSHSLYLSFSHLSLSLTLSLSLCLPLTLSHSISLSLSHHSLSAFFSLPLPPSLSIYLSISVTLSQASDTEMLLEKKILDCRAESAKLLSGSISESPLQSSLLSFLSLSSQRSLLPSAEISVEVTSSPFNFNFALSCQSIIMHFTVDLAAHFPHASKSLCSLFSALTYVASSFPLYFFFSSLLLLLLSTSSFPLYFLLFTF